jgi:DNA-binding NarL/FixJ family response regulator
MHATPNSIVKPASSGSESDANAPAETASIRVLTVDGHLLMREGFAAVIDREPGMALAAQASGGREAIDLYRKHRPDIVTVDATLPDTPVEVLVARLLSEFEDARVIVISASGGHVQMQRVLEAGVHGLVSREASASELIDAIRQVHAGKKIVPRQIASVIAEHLADETLTPREIQVLQLVARGNRNKEIAGHLAIAPETVRMHMKNILWKLSAHDRTHAVAVAVTRGIFQLEP